MTLGHGVYKAILLIECKNKRSYLHGGKDIGFIGRIQLELGAHAVEDLSLKGLAVNGSDLLGLGLKGAEIGKMQQRLLELVMEDELPNEKDKLLKYAEQECGK